MELSSVGASALTPEVQSQYAIKCIQMAQQSEQVVGDLLEDTVEISNEAMQKFLAERNA